jgi:hypothetical protein
MARNLAVRLTVAALLGLSTPLMACPSKEKSTVEKLTDDAKDALDVREHEKLKDAAEDASDALDDAADAVKEETQ